MRLSLSRWTGAALLIAAMGVAFSSWRRSIRSTETSATNIDPGLASAHPANHLEKGSETGISPGLSTREAREAQIAEPSTGRRDVPPVDEERVLQGRYVFERNCAACHGRWGDGRGELAEGMHPKPRKLTAGVFKFRSTPTGSLPMDSDLERTIRRGIANSSMPSFQHLPSRDVDAVIAFVKTLSSNWRRQTRPSVPVTLPTEPAWLYMAAESEIHRAAGMELFVVNCGPCHGQRGDGVSEIASALKDSWGQPCAPSDLRHEGLKCGPELTDVLRVLVTGLDGTPMPSFREAFTDEQLWEVVAHIGSLRSQRAIDAPKVEESAEP